MMRDVSEKDFAMRTMMPVSPGDTSAFSFPIDGEKRITGRCKVAEVDDDGHVARMEFTQLEDAMRTALGEWLQRIDRPPVPKAEAAVGEPREVATMEQLREEIRNTRGKVLPGSEVKTELPLREAEEEIEEEPAEAAATVAEPEQVPLFSETHHDVPMVAAEGLPTREEAPIYLPPLIPSDESVTEAAPAKTELEPLAESATGEVLPELAEPPGPARRRSALALMVANAAGAGIDCDGFRIPAIRGERIGVVGESRIGRTSGAGAADRTSRAKHGGDAAATEYGASGNYQFERGQWRGRFECGE